MNQWYAEGLIDPDMATLKFDQVSAKMTNGSAGVSIGFAGSRMGAWITAAQANDPNYMLVAAPYPTLEKGAKPEFGQMDNQYPGTASVAITTSCKDVERAARLLDYAYGEEGHMLFNFGVEGESYEMKDDYPTYTDWVMKIQMDGQYLRQCQHISVEITTDLLFRICVIWNSIIPLTSRRKHQMYGEIQMLKLIKCLRLLLPRKKVKNIPLS